MLDSERHSLVYNHHHELVSASSTLQKVCCIHRLPSQKTIAKTRSVPTTDELPNLPTRRLSRSNQILLLVHLSTHILLGPFVRDRQAKADQGGRTGSGGSEGAVRGFDRVRSAFCFLIFFFFLFRLDRLFGELTMNDRFTLYRSKGRC